MLFPKLYEDLSILHQNTMPVHSYFIPVSRQADAASARQTEMASAGSASVSSIQQIISERENSDRLQMLSGCAWQFRYFPSIHDLQDEFYRADYLPDEKWAQEIVPFSWQMRGYDENQYTNIRYPFPFDSPYVPHHNPCGAYIH